MPIDVAGWLRRLGLEQYEPAFRDNDVDAVVLPKPTKKKMVGGNPSRASCRIWAPVRRGSPGAFLIAALIASGLSSSEAGWVLLRSLLTRTVTGWRVW